MERSVKIINIALIALLSSATVCGYAQKEVNTRGLQTSIEARVQKLQKSMDSTEQLTEKIRDLYQSDAENRNFHAQRVIELEGQLYELQERVGQLKKQLAALGLQTEQGVDNNGEQPLGREGSKTGIKGLYNQPIFTENLTAEGMTLVKSSKNVESQIKPMIAEIKDLYENLDAIKQTYDETTSQDEVDKIQVQARIIKTQIKELDNKIQTSWGKLYGYKMDNYMVLNDIAALDRSVLEQLEQQSRAVRRGESLSEQQGLAPAAQMFSPQREVVLKYELALAQNYGLKQVADSLGKEIANSVLNPKLDFSDIDFAPRSLILYSAITTGKSNPYASVNEVPILKIPKTGVYYTIQVAFMQKALNSLTMFRGAYPLQIQKLSDGKVRYSLGGFSDYATAQKAVNQLVRAGFRAPTMIAWVNGSITTPAKAKLQETKIGAANQTTAGLGVYKIEVTGATNSSISTTLRDMVQQKATGKQIARVVQGDKYIFTITSFDSQNQAEALAQNIRSIDGAQVKVVEIK